MESVLLPSEIETYIDAMVHQKMKNIGSPQWLDWHQRLQKLSQEALVEAAALKEEQVKETLITFGKVDVLIHEAILVNVWKHQVLPHLLRMEPTPESTFVAYSVLYHEAVSVALLELVLYHPDCCQALEDKSADLLDYLCGTTARLLSVEHGEQQTQHESAEKELLRLRDNLSFEIGVRSLAVVRYLAENLDGLPFNIRSKMYVTYDVPVLFAQLLLARPWVKDGKLFSGGSWKLWDNEQLGQAEGQVWLTLRQLLLDPQCSKCYPLTQSRKNQLVQLLPLMKPTLLDQMSPLLDLNYWLCRLSALEETPIASPKPFLIESVLEMKGKILEECGGRWKKIAEKQLPVIFTNDKNRLTSIAQQLSEAYNTDLLEKFDVKDQVQCAQCCKGAVQRCSRCKKAWYCSRACQVKHWTQHKEECANADT